MANVGDSLAVVVPLDDAGQPSAPARYLTADHRLTNGAERDRLQGMGITLGHGGTRLYGLNLGRCLGDRYLKVSWEHGKAGRLCTHPPLWCRNHNTRVACPL